MLEEVAELRIKFPVISPMVPLLSIAPPEETAEEAAAELRIKSPVIFPMVPSLYITPP